MLVLLGRDRLLRALVASRVGPQYAGIALGPGDHKLTVSDPPAMRRADQLIFVATADGEVGAARRVAAYMLGVHEAAVAGRVALHSDLVVGDHVMGGVQLGEASPVAGQDLVDALHQTGPGPVRGGVGHACGGVGHAYGGTGHEHLAEEPPVVPVHGRAVAES